MGLNDPFWVQYRRFLRNALQGDLGISYFHNKPTLKVIMNKAPATLELVFATSIMIIHLFSRRRLFRLTQHLVFPIHHGFQHGGGGRSRYSSPP